METENPKILIRPQMIQGVLDRLTLEELKSYYIDKLEEENERIKKIACEKSEWISVQERLPDFEQNVLVYAEVKLENISPESVMVVTHRHKYRLTDCWSRAEPSQYFNADYKITHWMPLPEPPKEDEE